MIRRLRIGLWDIRGKIIDKVGNINRIEFEINKIIILRLTSLAFMANYMLKDFFDWIQNVENFFNYMTVPEEKKNEVGSLQMLEKMP